MIGNILRWGVYLSLSVALIGGVVFLYRHGSEVSQVQYQPFIEKDTNLLDLLKSTFSGVGAWRGYYIIELGILLLIATPITRVLFSLIAFHFEKDRLYVFITLLVLLIIFSSILTGFGG